MNTRVLFYWTSAANDGFYKTVFHTVLPGTPFESLDDVNEWEEQETDRIYREFDFHLVFDHVVLGYEETSKEPFDVEVLESTRGHLVFGPTVTSTREQDYREKVQDDREKDLDERELQLLKNETAVLKKEGEVIRKETAVLEKEGEVLRKELDVLKPKEKREYESCWVSPVGKVYQVGFAQHNEWAAEYLQENLPDEYTKSLNSFNKYFYESLQDLGWCRVLGWTDPPTFVFAQNPTRAVKEALKEYCYRNKVDYSGWPEELKLR